MIRTVPFRVRSLLARTTEGTGAAWQEPRSVAPGKSVRRTLPGSGGCRYRV